MGCNPRIPLPEYPAAAVVAVARQGQGQLASSSFVLAAIATLGSGERVSGASGPFAGEHAAWCPGYCVPETGPLQLMSSFLASNGTHSISMPSMSMTLGAVDFPL